MIRSFRGAETERIFDGETSAAFPPDIQATARRKLRQLSAAGALSDLAVPPGNRLERLQGNLAGKYSIRVNDQWRIVFLWDSGDAYEVEIVDYH